MSSFCTRAGVQLAKALSPHVVYFYRLPSTLQKVPVLLDDRLDTLFENSVESFHHWPGGGRLLTDGGKFLLISGIPERRMIETVDRDPRQPPLDILHS